MTLRGSIQRQSRHAEDSREEAQSDAVPEPLKQPTLELAAFRFLAQ